MHSNLEVKTLTADSGAVVIIATIKYRSWLADFEFFVLAVLRLEDHLNWGFWNLLFLAVLDQTFDVNFGHLFY